MGMALHQMRIRRQPRQQCPVAAGRRQHDLRRTFTKMQLQEIITVIRQPPVFDLLLPAGSQVFIRRPVPITGLFIQLRQKMMSRAALPAL